MKAARARFPRCRAETSQLVVIKFPHHRLPLRRPEWEWPSVSYPSGEWLRRLVRIWVPECPGLSQPQKNYSSVWLILIDGEDTYELGFWVIVRQLWAKTRIHCVHSTVVRYREFLIFVNAAVQLRTVARELLLNFERTGGATALKWRWQQTFQWCDHVLLDTLFKVKISQQFPPKFG